MTNIDKAIGLKIKEIRKGWGLSQIELAERIGVSFQQVQKYEKGTTRMSVFRLQQIAEALEVPVSVFFIEQKAGTPQVADPQITYMEGESESLPSVNKEGFVLLKLFRRIKNKKTREGLIRLLRGIVEIEEKK